MDLKQNGFRKKYPAYLKSFSRLLILFSLFILSGCLRMYDEPLKIVVTRQFQTSQIWIMDEDGQNQKYLDEGYQASWSPDGETIVYGSGTSMPYSLNTISSDGKNKKTIRTSENMFLYPSFFSEGGRIAFYEEVTSKIVVINNNGGELFRMNIPSVVTYLSVGPDGRISYSTFSGSYGYFILDITSGVIDTKIIGGAAGPDSATWSPDGKYLASILQGNVNIVNPATPLNTPPGAVDSFSGLAALQICWHPDGEHIFFSTAMGLIKLNILNRATSNVSNNLLLTYPGVQCKPR